MTGFQDGASGKPYPKPKGNHPEYLKGHDDGTKAWNDALAAARIRLKEPSLSYEAGLITPLDALIVVNPLNEYGHDTNSRTKGDELRDDETYREGS